ncbi:hypothetical protein CMU94_17325 [Elizabethkingia anophelis]|nr:hypothetical protein [Elizabethkingia anophelis]
MKTLQPNIAPAETKMNWFQHFMMLCSGANIHVLRKTPSEWNKYSGIGGVVLFTAVFATLSSGYAMYTIFDDIWAAIGFGLLWGLMIFNLDRYIVSSIKKTGTWWNQILMTIPRLILAAFLGIIIAKPLELKIFEKEVNKQLNTIIQRNKAELQAKINSRIMQQSGPYDKEKAEINSKLAAYQKSYDSASVELEKEILGKQSGLTSGKVGYGSNAKRKEELKKNRLADLQNYQKQVAPRLEYLDKETSKVYTNLEQELKNAEGAENRFNGFAARLQALDELGKASAIIALASTFIMGLFICLEISPVLIKLISSVGPYDWLLDKNENDVKVYAKEKIEKANISTEYRVNELKESLYPKNTSTL